MSLFSGAGGLDFGFEAAGFETAAAVELNHDCCETLRRSRPAWRVFERSIFDVGSDELLEAARAKAGEVDVVIGGPPCQPFSKAGYWANGDSLRLEDPRANTLAAYLRVVEDLQPQALLLENVEGLTYAGKDEGLRFLLRGFERINKRTGSRYRPVVRVLNAADYGVPQLRERVFIVAARSGTELKFPEPTHSGSQLTIGGLQPHRTAWDAIGDLELNEAEDLAVRGKWAELLPSIPEGKNYLWHTERGGGLRLFGWRERYWTFLLKLAKARPSWTIQAQPGPSVGPFHWSNRRLSVPELCRIQTFPDDVVVTGARHAAQRQIGNAVPSLLAEVLGREIRTQLLGLSGLRTPPKLLRPASAHIPAPEPHAAVPAKFLPLVGNHRAHPGTGLGKGARLRAEAAE